MTWPRALCMTLVLLAGPLASTVPAAENVWSVEYFNSRKSEWDQFAGATIRIEGRVSLSGGGQLRLAKCEVPIHGSDVLIRSMQGKKTIEIEGRLKKDNGKWILEADRIQQVPTDLEQFESRTAKLRNPKAPDWYALGDWAIDRSRFYDDAELTKKGLSAYEKGISAELRSLDAGDAEGRFQLAGKVAQFKLPDPLRMELVHEGDRILWDGIAKSNPANKKALTDFASRLANDLPGSTQSLAAFPAELTGRYEKEPLAVYRSSTESDRRQLHRVFYATVQMKLILDDAAADGRNGDLVASRLLQQVPEARQLAEKYQSLKLNWRLEQSETATRPEIEQLAADFRERRQPEQAQAALVRWLRAREPRLRDDGPVGLLQLADEYLALMQDERKAVQILVSAHKLDPAFTEVTSRLKSLGYENVGGTWVKTGAAPATVPVTENSVTPGNVAVGMNATTARKALGGRDSVARVLTKAGVSEVWCNGPVGSNRQVIRLERSGVSTELRVIQVQSEK